MVLFNEDLCCNCTYWEHDPTVCGWGLTSRRLWLKSLIFAIFLWFIFLNLLEPPHDLKFITIVPRLQTIITYYKLNFIENDRVSDAISPLTCPPWLLCPMTLKCCYGLSNSQITIYTSLNLYHNLISLSLFIKFTDETLYLT